MSAVYRTECAQCAVEGQKAHKVVQKAQDSMPSSATLGAVVVRCDICGAQFDYRPKRVLANCEVKISSGGTLLEVRDERGWEVVAVSFAGRLIEELTPGADMYSASFTQDVLASQPWGKGYLRGERFRLALTRYAHIGTVRDFVAALHAEGARWEADEEWKAQQAKADSARSVAVEALVEGGFGRDEAEEMVNVKLPAKEVPWPSFLVGDSQPVDGVEEAAGDEDDEEEAVA